MIRRMIILGLLLAVSTTVWSQQTIVFPAVSDEVEGRNGSLWSTVVRVVKTNPYDTVTIRRKWVCREGGGFLDDSNQAPSWTLPGGGRERVLLVTGAKVLAGAETQLGAVALEVEGGEVLAHSHVADVTKGYYLPGTVFVFGQGQLIPAFREPLQGPSHIPWLGGCLNWPCSQPRPDTWDFYRNNIGIVNPNSEPLSVTGTVIPFAVDDTSGILGEIIYGIPEHFIKHIPPFGWLQFHWQETRGHDSFFSPHFPPYVVSLTPDKDLPYYAYASVVFTPDPDSEIPVFNDPMFVPAEPGYVAPFSEVDPPKESGK